MTNLLRIYTDPKKIRDLRIFFLSKTTFMNMMSYGIDILEFRTCGHSASLEHILYWIHSHTPVVSFTIKSIYSQTWRIYSKTHPCLSTQTQTQTPMPIANPNPVCSRILDMNTLSIVIIFFMFFFFSQEFMLAHQMLFNFKATLQELMDMTFPLILLISLMIKIHFLLVTPFPRGWMC